MGFVLYNFLFFKFSLKNKIEKKIPINLYYINKWRLIQLVIQLKPISVKGHGNVDYVAKTKMLIVNLGVSIPVSTNEENELN